MNIEKLFINGEVSLYGYNYKSLPEVIPKLSKKKILIAYLKHSIHQNYFSSTNVKLLDSINQVGLEDNDINNTFLLDQSFTKCLIKSYPSNPQYVFVSLSNPFYYPYILIGIIRRLLLRKINIIGIRSLIISKSNTYWILLSRNTIANGFTFYLSREFGIKNFLKFLHFEHINYVILRSYDALPVLSSLSSDIDMLVDSRDVEKVKTFLIENTGTQRIDIWSSNSPDFNGVPYFPEDVSKNVLARSIDGPCLSKIPNKYDELNLLIFHCLYHKGFNSGIRSKYRSYNCVPIHEKYSKRIKTMSNKLGINIGSNMEDMHFYLIKKKLTPRKDQLIKLSKNNEWIKCILRE
ncbi:hypothetical protein [Prochlorococcus marinus]|uniref:Uncharacterized protein n=1 Tax=Prochlorococcus marinus XMU1408 TaxID=2213228 RepID=A0A318RAN5_PROMR|nr:hypothetical protein [Prochlorococcus marinus]MBW3041820.1 hypothetical protein [Prochlorococcus marinus str. XMU1408]PYE02959.1 hypothetical protein DNJ73_04215 [Prochlorococcus marinus XMU1408]